MTRQHYHRQLSATKKVSYQILSETKSKDKINLNIQLNCGLKQCVVQGARPQ